MNKEVKYDETIEFDNNSIELTYSLNKDKFSIYDSNPNYTLEAIEEYSRKLLKFVNDIKKDINKNK